jgi:hypothetical protein
VFSCLPFCHALFLGGFHWFSEGYAPWLRGACMVADGVVVFVCVFGLGFWRGIVGRVAVVLRYVLSYGVFGVGIRGVRVIFGGNLGQISIFGGMYVELAFMLVGIGGWLSGAERGWVLLVVLGMGLFWVVLVLGGVGGKRSLCPCAFVPGGQRRWWFDGRGGGSVG